MSDRYSAVTAPRQIIPGQFYLVTRRCTQRQFLLRPSQLTNQIVRYSLGLAAAQTGVLLHAVCFMSNHWHGVVSDPDGQLPEFIERFHRLIARAQNASLGRGENFWSCDKTSVVLLVSEEDVLDKMAYTMANPTAAGLVRSPTEWPGVISLRFEELSDVEMPNVFFDENGDLPDEVDLAFTRPDIYRDLSDLALLTEIQAVVAERVKAARTYMDERGLRFLGKEAVVRQPFDGAPSTPANRSSPKPRIAAKSKPKRIAAIRRLIEFLRAYRVAWLARRDGEHGAIFPFGTYALRIHAGVACAQPP